MALTDVKAGFFVLGVALVGAAFWVSGVLTPPARHLLITNATASPMAGGAAAVLTIDNQGAPDKLVDVTSTLGNTSFHNADRGLPIRTGTSSLALDAAHIMIAPTEAGFDDGALLPLTLRFETAGEVSVKARFSVPEPGSKAAHMAMGHGAMLQNVTTGPLPTLDMRVTQSESGWTAQIITENFSFSEDLQDGDHVPGVGHGHIYLGDMKLGRVFSESFGIGALPKGTHLLRVTLNTNDHRTYAVKGQPLAAEAIIQVD